jgi:tetratricopeptide (TPR) repeat protein
MLLQVEGAKQFWSWPCKSRSRKRKSSWRHSGACGRSTEYRSSVEAYRSAGSALRSLGQFALALGQYEKALTLSPNDLESRRQKGLLLGRMKKRDTARKWLQDLARDIPDDSESWALLGRVEKDSWMAGWRAEGKTVEQMRQDAAADDALLQEVIDVYTTGFRKIPLTITQASTRWRSCIAGSPDGQRRGARIAKEMEGGVRWAVRER